MEIKVNEATMNYLEGLFFDIIGYEKILKDIFFTYKNNPDYIHNKENCEYFLEEYKKCNQKYQCIKSQIISEYLPKEYRHDNYYCEFSFEKNTMIIKTHEGCVSCVK